MSYYEDGLGQILPGNFGPVTGLTVSQPATTTTSSTLVNVGVPAALIAAIAAHLDALGKSMGSGDAGRPPILLAAAALKLQRPNQYGLIDPAKAASALSIVPVTVSQPSDRPYMPATVVRVRDFVDRSLATAGLPKISTVLSDIAAGKYAGSAPTQNLNLASLTAAAALKSQTAVTAATSAQTQQTIANQAAATAQQTQAAADQAAAQQAQAAADQAAAAAQAAAQDAAAAMTQVAQSTPGDQSSSVGPSDLVPAQPPAQAAPSGGIAGVPWLYVGIGAAGLAVVGWLYMSRKPSTPNRRSRKNRHHKKRARRVTRKA